MRWSRIHPERVQKLNSKDLRRGDYVLYWMQQSQRAEHNHALEYAIEQANELHLPVVVVFGLTADYPEANLRHYVFMLAGLTETQAALAARRIPMAVRLGQPAKVALAAGKRAALIVCDRGYLRHQKAWRREVAEHAGCGVVQVETDVIVPVNCASTKREFAARTIRAKIHKRLAEFLVALRRTPIKYPTSLNDFTGLEIGDGATILKKLKIDRAVGPVTAFFRGGTADAKQRFENFLRQGLAHYKQNRNQPQTDHVSHMSPYLHFGQISPLYLALRISGERSKFKENADAYFEELIVRRELAINFVEFTPDYDVFECLPDWAKATLESHCGDRREHLYSVGELERAETHDRYWNAACEEMKRTGYMHSYMRMYWAKKILEWSRTPRAAFSTTLAIMNRYFLDGRDPNSYTGVAWVYGNHDRPFYDREVFGRVRYMSSSGLERKCDIDAYVAKVNRLSHEQRC
jgi:deoxyribodipyrimidine photo-lyase